MTRTQIKKTLFTGLIAFTLFSIAGTNSVVHAGESKSAKRPTASDSSGESQAKPKVARRQSIYDQFVGAGYGLAGCGLGSIIFGAKPGMVQVVAATTNNYFFPQTSAITSGTSNCEIPEMGYQVASYIEMNRGALTKEIARGDGDYLEGLGDLLNCTDREMLNSSLREKYSHIFKSSNAYNSTREILNIIESNEKLKSTCGTKVG